MATKEEPKKTEIVSCPIGNLTKTTYETADGRTITSLHGTREDLHAWENKEFGIDDAQRAAQAQRDVALGKIAADASFAEIMAGKPNVEVLFGNGNRQMIFTRPVARTSHYPEKQADGTSVVKTVTKYGPMTMQSRLVLSRDVRQYVEQQNAEIEAKFAKAAVKPK